ncbi:MAG: cyclodeaminase/cyclohydrolase family protein [Firmicutes bacterium]|nr:cyclodeaminase/cyclohydrolase family protein [Bacillota bacterium]
MLTSLPVPEFLAEFASDKPTPGGGSSSAFAGALAGALVQMVGRLSGKEQAQLVAKSEILVTQLTHMANCDADAFNQVMTAYKMPRATAEEKSRRTDAIQRGTKLATEVPLRVMELSLDVLRLAGQIAVQGNTNALSDAGVAGLLSAAAVKGAYYNVLINLPGLKDRDFVKSIRDKLKGILGEAEKLETELAAYVLKTLQ